MKAYDVKKLSYRDKLARRNRLFFIFKIIGVLGALGAAGAGLVYILFFSKFLEVRDISFNGLSTVSAEEFEEKINARLDQKMFGFFPRRSNLFLGLNSENLEDEISSAYPVFKSVKVEKDIPHGLIINFEERKPAGIWCARLPDRQVGLECRYFDNEMATWGPAAKTSGFLMLTVNDERLGDEFKIEKSFFDAIGQVVVGLSGPTIKSIIIPENSFDEFRVYTDRSFYIVFSLDSNIKDQLEVLKIFLEEKSKTPGFNPQYLDLRIEGRIYFK